MSLTVAFRRGKDWEKRIAKFLPGAKLYERGVSTPDFCWAPELTGCELQFEIKSTSDKEIISELTTIREALSCSSIIQGYNGALEIYEGLKFVPSSAKGGVPYAIRYSHAYTVVPLELLSFWFNNKYWFRNGNEKKGWRVRPSFPYYPPMGKKLNGLFRKGRTQLEKYLAANNAKGGGVVIAAVGRRTRDQLCFIPDTFLGRKDAGDERKQVQVKSNDLGVFAQAV